MLNPSTYSAAADSDAVRAVRLEPQPAWLKWLLWFYGPLLLLLAAARAYHPLSGEIDTWAHAAIGRWIWEHQQVPQHTLFIWGADPIPWVAHSWLSQLLFFGALRVLGPAGPVLLTIVCTVTVFALLWRGWMQRARPNFFATVLFILAITAASPRFYPRPELFTVLFLTLLLLFLLRRTEQSTTTMHIGQASGLVVMFAVWINLHGAVALGLVFLVLTLLGDGLQDRFDGRWRMLLAIAFCCAGATLVNPYGVEAWEALRSVNSQTFKAINEWKPPWQSPALDPLFIVVEAMLAMIAFVAWLGNPQRRWSHLLWLIFASASFISARRNLWVLAIVCLVVLIANAQLFDTERAWQWWRRRTMPQDGQWQPVPTGMRAIMRIGTLSCLVAAVAFATPHDIMQFRMLSRKAPVALTRFYREQRIQGRVFNDYEYSSYLQWAFAGRPPLYIDLLNAYPDWLLGRYFDVLDRKPNGRAILRRADVVILRPFKPKEKLAGFAKFLNARPTAWVRVYKGRDGTIWVRRNPRNQHVWRRF